MSTTTTTPTSDPAYSSYQHLLVRVDEATGVAVVTLNRPAQLNAMNVALHREVGDVWRDLDRDARVRCSVVTGAGKAFSAGGDLDMAAAMTRDAGTRRDVMRDARQIVRGMIDAEKPIVSAVNGVAVGAGMVVAVTADVVVASEDAKFGDGHTKLGVAAGDHACAVWPLAMGLAKAKLYLLTGDMLSAAAAERLGLVSEVVAPDRALPRALELAARIAAGPPHAVRATKFALNQWLRDAALKSMDLSLALEMLNFAESDVREGIAAIREKRAPSFSKL